MANISMQGIHADGGGVINDAEMTRTSPLVAFGALHALATHLPKI